MKSRPKRYAETARQALKLRHNPKFANKNRLAITRYARALAMPYLARFFGHLRIVTLHKLYVLQYSFYAGIPWRGLTHDWSKFSPTEFLESVRYFNGRRSPVGLCREFNGGYSLAWLHHRGRNRHHFDYWLENVDENGASLLPSNTVRPLLMPYQYALEMVCDSIAANRAYNGKKFSVETLCAWWSSRGSQHTLHPAVKKFCNELYELMRSKNSFAPLKQAREIYERVLREEGIEP